MASRKAQGAKGELLSLAAELAEVMDRRGCRSAMVRTFMDDSGRMVASCNLYGAGRGGRMDAQRPVVELREVIR